MGNVIVTGPNEVAVITGSITGNQKVTNVIGGWGFAWKFVSVVQRMDLNMRAIQLKAENAEDSRSVPISVFGILLAKIGSSPENLKKAIPFFLGKDADEQNSIIRESLIGTLRSVINKMQAYEIYWNREELIEQLKGPFLEELDKFGIEFLSFKIQKVSDNQGYFDSVGKNKIAATVNKANVEVTQELSKADVKETDTEMQIKKTEFQIDERISKAESNYEKKKSNFQQIVNRSIAETSRSYEYKNELLKKELYKEQVGIELAKQKNKLVVEKLKVLQEELELKKNVNLTAESDAKRIQDLAEGNKIKSIILAKAEAEKIQIISNSEAKYIRTKGIADALDMKLKAESYKNYQQTAMLTQALDKMPEIAAGLAAPFTKTNEIVLVNTRHEIRGNGEDSDEEETISLPGGWEIEEEDECMNSNEYDNESSLHSDYYDYESDISY